MEKQVSGEHRPNHEMLYAPILKGKLGELTALKELSPLVRAKVLPIMEVPEVPWDYVDDKYAKTISAHIEGFAKKVVECWGVDYPIIIDTLFVDDVDDKGVGVMDYLLNYFRTNGVQAIPVVTFDDSEIHKKGVIKHLEKLPRICLRVTSDDIAEKDWSAEVTALFNETGLTYENTDLLIDFKDVRPEQESMVALTAKMSINSIPDIEKFNSLIVGMTSFPENLSDHDRDSMNSIPRAEWKVWNTLRKTNLKRYPTFADYGISSAFTQRIDPRIMQMSANIRYTHKEDWVIVKGKGVKDHSYEQFYDLSGKLVKSTFFYGEKYSWGDNAIKEKSEKKGGTGNATTWREIGTNHHISVVVGQITSIVSGS